MSIGAMNKRIAFWRMGGKKDDGGGQARIPVLYKTVWADCQPVNKYLHVLGGGENFTSKKVFRIRFDSQVNSSMVIQFPTADHLGEFYKIKEIEDVAEAGLYMEITAEKYGGS